MKYVILYGEGLVGGVCAGWLLTNTVALFADATTPDTLSGGAGWVGAGLLGLVLGWLLLKHLPAKDQQINDFIANKDRSLAQTANTKDEQLNAQRHEFTKTLSEMMSAFRQEATAERQACEKHFATLADSMNAAFKTLGDQLNSHSQRNQQWLEVLKTRLTERGISVEDQQRLRDGS